MEEVLSDPAGLLALPEGEQGSTAVLVLSGSSGRIEVDRVRLLAGHGVPALSLRWFGDIGQPPGICEVPLETFAPALDRLAGLADRIAVVGLSKGAEAALLIACEDKRVVATAALSPTAVVWANVGAGLDGADRPQRSSFSRDGRGLPFVPYDDEWRPPSAVGPVTYVGLYEQSLRCDPDIVAAATIPVERIQGQLLVTAGLQDGVWPAAAAARLIAGRRQEHGLATTVLLGAGAGHRVVMPGERAAPPNPHLAAGGSQTADESFGRTVWAALVNLLDIPNAKVH